MMFRTVFFLAHLGHLGHPPHGPHGVDPDFVLYALHKGRRPQRPWPTTPRASLGMARGRKLGLGVVDGGPGGLQGPGDLCGRDLRAKQIHNVCFLPFHLDSVSINSETSGTMLKLAT